MLLEFEVRLIRIHLDRHILSEVHAQFTREGHRHPPLVALEVEVQPSMEVKVHHGMSIVSIGMFRPIPVCLCVRRWAPSLVLYHNGRPADLNTRRGGSYRNLWKW